jgi:hypothetical protein
MQEAATANYPALSALARDGDKRVLKSIRDFMTTFTEEDAPMAANDNDPEFKIKNAETRIDGLSAEELILSMAEDENCERDPDFERTTKSYSKHLHEERFERVKYAKASPAFSDRLPTEDAMLHRIHVKQVREKLGRDAEILDIAASPNGTFREVGELLGFTGKYAERKGKAAVIEAAKNFEKLVA